MERHLDDELQKLKSNLLKMATLTEEGIHNSIESLKNQDSDLAESVIQDDQKIDALELTIEEHAIELLALFQPMASDLRFITTGMRINTELERIADLNVNICQRVKELSSYPLLKPLVEIPQLADVAKEMVREAIDAFVRRDKETATKVILTDKQANELRNKAMEQLMNDYLIKDGSTAPRAIPLFLIARDLERICDHAASISEDVIYMVQAKMIRHHRERLLAIESIDSEE
ncbi:MAG: phosphate signaling complex protein PhoU [Candidatus Omnitrophica bacterium]|nr:phosphate signaling complex protein PhoU [Candidatus Omnitrophota bacterium]